MLESLTGWLWEKERGFTAFLRVSKSPWLKKRTDITRFIFYPIVSWGEWIQKKFEVEGIALVSLSILECSKFMTKSRGAVMVVVCQSRSLRVRQRGGWGTHKHNLGPQGFITLAAPVWTLAIFPQPLLQLGFSQLEQHVGSFLLHCSFGPGSNKRRPK